MAPNRMVPELKSMTIKVLFNYLTQSKEIAFYARRKLSCIVS